MDSKIYKRVIDTLREREATGIKKYQTTMDRNDLSLGEWLNHLQEELMDATIYLEKLKQEVEYQEYELRSPCSAHDAESSINIERERQNQEEERERRMNIIGQNGNDGLHYGMEEDGTGYVDYPDNTISTPTDAYDGWDNTRSLYPGDITITYTQIKADGTED